MKSSKYFVLLATVPGLAVAQDCADIEDDKERLACYDSQYTPTEAVTEPPAVPPAPPPEAGPIRETASAPEPEIAPDAPADNFGLKEASDKPKQTVSARIEKIQTAGSVDYLYLDNGQVWRETGGDSGVRFKKGATVTITEGALGSYDLVMEGRNRKAKVKRVR